MVHSDSLKKMDKNIAREVFDFLLPLVIIALILMKVVVLTVVESGSMEPTLNVGNTVVFNRLSFCGDRQPERGDIVVFSLDETDLMLCKRVIGLPGDEITFVDGSVIINGEMIDESKYLNTDVETNCTETFKVPEDSYFMLGDNRENSYDSRYWKNPYVLKNRLIGKYIGQVGFSFKYDIWNRIVSMK